MRHFGSLLVAAVFAPSIFLLTGTGLSAFNSALDDNKLYDPLGSLAALGALLLAGVLYGILVMARLSPLGPGLAGFASWGISGWALFDIEAYQRFFSQLDVHMGGAVGETGLGIVLGIPLVATLFSGRRWRRSELYSPRAMPVRAQPDPAWLLPSAPPHQPEPPDTPPPSLRYPATAAFQTPRTPAYMPPTPEPDTLPIRSAPQDPFAWPVPSPPATGPSETETEAEALGRSGVGDHDPAEAEARGPSEAEAQGPAEADAGAHGPAETETETETETEAEGSSEGEAEAEAEVQAAGPAVSTPVAFAAAPASASSMPAISAETGGSAAPVSTLPAAADPAPEELAAAPRISGSRLSTSRPMARPPELTPASGTPLTDLPAIESMAEKLASWSSSASSAGGSEPPAPIVMAASSDASPLPRRVPSQPPGAGRDVTVPIVSPPPPPDNEVTERLGTPGSIAPQAQQSASGNEDVTVQLRPES